MKKYCPLCGSALENGICPNHHETKAMCLNCTFCREQEDGEVVCDNSDNLKDAREKLLASFASQQANGYAIKKLDVEIEPLPLKKPTLMCNRWKLNTELVVDAFLNTITVKSPKATVKPPKDSE